VKTRSSCREFADDAEITDGQLLSILECANRAPSAGDLQAYKIVVVRLVLSYYFDSH
jgi:nitroreductase